MPKLFWCWMIVVVVFGNGMVAAQHYVGSTALTGGIFGTMVLIGIVCFVIGARRALRIRATSHHMLGWSRRDLLLGRG